MSDIQLGRVGGEDEHRFLIGFSDEAWDQFETLLAATSLSAEDFIANALIHAINSTQDVMEQIYAEYQQQDQDGQEMAALIREGE